MSSRIVSIWFPHLMTDWLLRRNPQLKALPFALSLQEKNRKVIKAVNSIAQNKGVYVNMVQADCKAILPELKVFDYDNQQCQKLIRALAEWCIRYSPVVSIDLPDGILIDAAGCTHLWGGEQTYLNELGNRLLTFGYQTNIAMADTVGAAWALSHYRNNNCIIQPGKQIEALFPLPPVALRLEDAVVARLQKLGLNTIGSFMNMPRSALRRRFGQDLLTKLAQALGEAFEPLVPIMPPAPYQERLPCLDPVKTAPGIERALKTVLETLCQRLSAESKGLRKCILQCYRVDGNIQSIEIGTNRPSRNLIHLFKLFENKISSIEPDLGIELFIVNAPIVEDLQDAQDALWNMSKANENAVAELLDRLVAKLGKNSILRYLPAEHYWPERSIKEATSLSEKANSVWPTHLPRPIHLLSKPEAVEVSVPIPDYPPLMFIYKGLRHEVVKADGPERIEQEWWIEQGLYRDYYCVEDIKGARYWLFRLGDYNKGTPKWFIHGFFA